MITLAEARVADNRAAKPAPPHFRKLFFAREARRLNHANSAAAAINVAKASKSGMAHSWRSRVG
jgi:hypothetical protein